MNSEKSFKRAFNDSKNLKSIYSCSVQKLFKACRNCDSARELSQIIQELLKSKISINAFILWKMRPIFEKCSWLIWSIHWIHHTHKQSAHHSREKIVWIDWFYYLIEINVNDFAVAMFSSLRLDKEH